MAGSSAASDLFEVVQTFTFPANARTTKGNAKTCSMNWGAQSTDSQMVCTRGELAFDGHVVSDIRKYASGKYEVYTEPTNATAAGAMLATPTLWKHFDRADGTGYVTLGMGDRRTGVLHGPGAWVKGESRTKQVVSSTQQCFCKAHLVSTKQVRYAAEHFHPISEDPSV